MIIVTGGAGMIGSNLIMKLNTLGYDDICVVDNLENGKKFLNLVNLNISDYLDKDDFLQRLENFDAKKILGIFHLGACSKTTEWNGKYMMENNFEYSKKIFLWCQKKNIPFIYSSSAAVYGNGENGFRVNENNLFPLNIYGYSKLLFDKFVMQFNGKFQSQVVGLRYFNVYGPNENHKNDMASVAFHLNNQMLKNKVLKLFEGTLGYENGEQLRDFVYVKDCASVNAWFLENRKFSGIFNVGTGVAQTFNEIAKSIIKWYGYGKIEYIKFPEELKNSYQNYTKADISELTNIGYNTPFTNIQDGINDYLNILNKNIANTL